MKLRLFFLNVAVLFSSAVFSQLPDKPAEKDSCYHKLFVYVDPSRAAINEITVGAELRFSNKHAVGISYGNIYYNKLFDGRFYNHYKNNFSTVYSGFAFRLNYKWYLSKKVGFYFSPQFVYKYIHYPTHIFFWAEKGTGYYDAQSEKTNVFGLDFLFGVKSDYKHFGIDWYYGLGYRQRERDIQEYYSFRSYPGPLSSYVPYPLHKTNIFPTVLFGIKLGVGFWKSKL